MALFSGVFQAVNELLYGPPQTPQTYWGTPIADLSTGTQSPRLIQLFMSIHKTFLVLQGKDDPRCASFTGLTPGTFLCFAKTFHFVHDFETPLPTNDLNLATRAYYTAMSMPFSTWKNTNMPLLPEEGLARWILLQLWTHPSKTGETLNKILSSTNAPPIDGSTGKEFLYKTIPDESLPKLRSDAARLMEERLREWKEAVFSQCLGQSQNAMQMQLQMQLRQQQQYIQMQMQTQRNTQMMALASQGAAIAQQQAWNNGVNAASMSWGQW